MSQVPIDPTAVIRRSHSDVAPWQSSEVFRVLIL